MNIHEAVEDTIRWHYYDRRRGHDTADPSLSGMGSSQLAGLEENVTERTLRRLKAQAEYWADYELHKPYGPPDYGTTTWAEAEAAATEDEREKWEDA